MCLSLNCSLNSTITNNYFSRYRFSRAIVPGILGLTLIGWIIFKFLPCCKAKKSLTTNESVKVAIFEILFLVIYTLYTSISTSIFELFNCELIQGQYYLISDYSKICFDDEWGVHAAVGFAGMALFTVGIPLFLFYLMCSNQRFLFPEECDCNDDYKHHARVITMYGSMYEDYSSTTYFFDLLDLFRRLMLTGGLMLLGESSNIQIFLACLICCVWCTTILWVKPYGSFWDSTLSATLNFQLLIIIISGMALEIYRLTPSYDQDPKAKIGMGVFMVFLTVLLTVSGFLVIFISLPCLRDKVTEKLCGCVDGEKNEEEEDVAKEIKIEEKSNTNPKQKSIVITIPKGTHEGNNVQVNLPNGKSIDVTVPKGMKAGNTMTINYDDDDAPVKKGKEQHNE